MVSYCAMYLVLILALKVSFYVKKMQLVWVRWNCKNGLSLCRYEYS